MPNPPGANPLVAERAPLEVFAILCDRGPAAYWKSLQIPVISSAHLVNPCVTPIATRGEGSFSYQGVMTRGVRHAPEAASSKPTTEFALPPVSLRINLLRPFFPQNYFYFLRLFLKTPPKIAFKTSVKITSRGYF